MRQNPFKPGLPIDPKQFVGRKKEIELFVRSLGQASYSNPQNLAIMGDRGIGKSSLLRKFESIAKEKNYLVVRRDMDAGVDSLNTLAYCILCALKQEGQRYFSTNKKTKSAVIDFFQKYKISVSVAGFGGSVEKLPSAAIQEEFYSALSDISKSVQETVPAIVIMLDEVEHIQSIKGSWGFLRSVFSRLLENGHPFLIIVSGKLGLFTNIKEIFSPMERFFFPREIGLMDSAETVEAIEKPMAENGIAISEDVKNLWWITRTDILLLFRFLDITYLKLVRRKLTSPHLMKKCQTSLRGSRFRFFRID